MPENSKGECLILFKENNKKIFLNVRETLRANEYMSHIETPYDDEKNYSVACDIHKTNRIAFGIKKEEPIAFMKGSVKTNGYTDEEIMQICDPLVESIQQMNYTININKIIFQMIVPVSKDTFEENDGLVFEQLALFVKIVSQCCNKITGDDVITLEKTNYVKKKKEPIQITPDTNIPEVYQEEETKEESAYVNEDSVDTKDVYTDDIIIALGGKDAVPEQKAEKPKSSESSKKQEVKPDKEPRETKAVENNKRDENKKEERKEEKKEEKREGRKEDSRKPEKTEKSGKPEPHENKDAGKKQDRIPEKADREKKVYEEKKGLEAKPQQKTVKNVTEQKLTKQPQKEKGTEKVNEKMPERKSEEKAEDIKETNGRYKGGKTMNIYEEYKKDLDGLNIKYKNSLRNYSPDELIGIVENRHANEDSTKVPNHIREIICNLAKDELKFRLGKYKK